MDGWLVTGGRWLLTFSYVDIFCPMTSDWMAGDRWLNSCIIPIWLVTGARWLVCYVFLSIGQMAGGRLTGGRLTSGRWTYTPLGTRLLGVATWMGPPPGSRAIWGGDPIQISSSEESDMALWSLLLLSHEPLSRSVIFFSKFPGLSNQELHREQVIPCNQKSI